MKITRLLCTVIAGAALMYGASAGASSNQPPHDADSKIRNRSMKGPHAKAKDDVASAGKKHRQTEKSKSENTDTPRSPVSIKAIHDALAAFFRRTMSMPVRPIHPSRAVPPPWASPGNVRNRGPVFIGGPVDSARSTAALNGTAIKRRH
jgi:hypothetical protein